MQQPDSFEDAKRFYFGLGRRRDRDLAQRILQTLWESDQNKPIKAKAAYFLGVIHLTDVIRANLPITPKTSGLTVPQKGILTAGLEWLRKSHEFGFETASLLLAKLHAASNQDEFDAIQIEVDGVKFISRPFYARELFSPVYVIPFLFPVSKANQQAALLLGNYAREWLKLIENIILNDSPIYKQDDEKLARFVQKPFAFTPPEQEYHQIYSSFLADFDNEVGDLTEDHSKENLDFMREKVEAFIIATHRFSQRRVLAAIELMRDVFANQWFLCHLLDGRFAPNHDRALELQELVWDIRLEKTVIALSWLENSIILKCSNHPSRLRLGLFSCSQVYIRSRLEGTTHEQGKAQYDLATAEVNKSYLKEAVSHLGTTFFTTSNLAQQAQSFFESNQFELAAFCFKRMISGLKTQNSESEELADYYLKLAQCYLETHNFDHAPNACDQALKICKNLGLAQKYNDVVMFYKRWLEVVIPLIEKVITVALKFMDEGKYDKAKIYFDYVLAHTHDSRTLAAATLTRDVCVDKLAAEKENPRTAPQGS